MHLSHIVLNLDQCWWVNYRFQFLKHVTAIHAQKHGAFAGTVGHAQLDSHQKSVKLGFRQRKSTDGMLRILCGDHKKRLGQLIGHAVDGNAVFFHCFQQRTLRFGSRAIDLVDQHQLRKKRAAMKHEALLAPIED